MYPTGERPRIKDPYGEYSERSVVDGRNDHAMVRVADKERPPVVEFIDYVRVVYRENVRMEVISGSQVCVKRSASIIGPASVNLRGDHFRGPRRQIVFTPIDRLYNIFLIDAMILIGKNVRY